MSNQPIRAAVGEIPEAVEWQFLDSDGLAISLLNFTAKGELTAPDGTASTLTTGITISSAVDGEVTYEWKSTDLTMAGLYKLVIWANRVTPANRYASDVIVIDVEDRGTVPTFP